MKRPKKKPAKKPAKPAEPSSFFGFSNGTEDLRNVTSIYLEQRFTQKIVKSVGVEPPKAEPKPPKPMLSRFLTRARELLSVWQPPEEPKLNCPPTKDTVIQEPREYWIVVIKYPGSVSSVSPADPEKLWTHEEARREMLRLAKEVDAWRRFEARSRCKCTTGRK